MIDSFSTVILFVVIQDRSVAATNQPSSHEISIVPFTLTLVASVFWTFSVYRDIGRCFGPLPRYRCIFLGVWTVSKFRVSDLYILIFENSVLSVFPSNGGHASCTYCTTGQQWRLDISRIVHSMHAACSTPLDDCVRLYRHFKHVQVWCLHETATDTKGCCSLCRIHICIQCGTVATVTGDQIPCVCVRSPFWSPDSSKVFPSGHYEEVAFRA